MNVKKNRPLPDIKRLTEMFDYLDDLRESGVTNMYRAAPYLEEAFNLERRDSSPIVGAWMKTFNRETSAKERADKARATS